MKRRLATGFAVVAAVLAASGFFYHRHYQNALRAEAEKMLLSIEQIKLAQLRSWREERANTVLSLLDGQPLHAYLRAFASDVSDKKAAAALRGRLQAFISRNRFQSAALAGPEGRELLYAGGRPEAMGPGLVSLLARAKASGRPELGEFYLHAGETVPHIDMAALVPGLSGGRPIFLLLRMDPSEFLYPLLQTWSGKGVTGEILLVGRDGDELVFLNDLRHVRDAAMRLRRPLGMQELTAAMGLRGKTGIVEGRDYRGVPVMAAVGPVPGTSWAMVTKMDLAEVMKGSGPLGAMLVLLVLALLAAAGAGAYLLVMRQAAAYERIKISYELFSGKANDGILIVDMATRTVLEANRKACEMYGYTPEAMTGLKAEAVIPPGDLEAFRERIAGVTRAGGGLYEAEHLRADGTAFPAEISSSVVDIEGKSTMFVIVRDVTERKSAQRLLSRLTEQVPGVVYQYRLYPDGRSCFPYASSGMEMIYEVTPDEVREDATPVFGRLHPDELKATSEAIFASARDLSLFHWEFRVVLPRQGLRWRLCDARPERLPDGGTLWHGIITDITDRKLAEQELRTLAQQRELALSAARLGWWRYDPVSKIAFYDERYKEIFEVTGSSKPNAEILKRLHQEDLPGVWAKVNAALDPARRENYSADYRINLPDGRVKWVEAHGLASFDGPGPGARAVELVGTVADVTERRLLEEALTRSEEQFRTMFERHSAVMLLISPENGRILDANLAAERFYGHPRERLREMNIGDINVSHRAGLLDTVREVNSGARAQFEAEHKLADGGVRTVDVHASAVVTSSGRVNFAIVHDITDKKTAERRIQKLNRELQDKNREMENFLYITTHDLRSPLVNIQGFTRNLQRYLGEIRAALAGAGLPAESRAQALKVAEEKVPEALGFVLESSAKMDALLTALLKVSRMGRQQLQPGTVEMGPMLARIVDTISFQVREAGVEVKLGELPPCLADAASVNQLFSNLLDNAVKYGSGGKPPVITVSGELAGSMAVYRVADNGRGIPAADQERLWNVFYRPAGPGRKNGEGIGLPLCRRIAERNGGGIRLEPAPGGGSVFVVELPAAPTEGK